MFRVIMTWVSSHQCFLPQVLLNMKILAIFKTHLPSIREAVCSSLLHYHVGKFKGSPKVLFGGKVFLWGPQRTFRGATRIINATWHECRTFLFSLSRRRFKLHWNFCLRFSFEPPRKKANLSRGESLLECSWITEGHLLIDQCLFVCKPVKHNFVNKY